MKKLQVLAASLGLLAFAACSNNDDVFTGSEDLAAEALQDNAITFGTYTGQAAQTRATAAYAGAITTEKLKGEANGFGVYAYWTGDGADQTYEQRNGTTAALAPNFMTNTNVTWSTGKWVYSPVKYWPNDIAATNVDSQPATGSADFGGKVSFFAYAPWTDDPGTEGITALPSGNGDPILTYVIPDAKAELVDLLWGTCGDPTSKNVVNGTNAGVASTADDYITSPLASPRTSWQKDILKGYTMNADFTKQLTQGMVNFAFKHALAKVGGADVTDDSKKSGFMIIADFDKESDGAITGGTQASGNKITVKEINIVARSKYNDGVSDKYLKKSEGQFNLATGKWKITDGANLTETVGEAAATNFSVANAELNSAIKDAVVEYGTLPTGVTTTAQNVYADAEGYPLVFIPGTKPELEVTIEYYVNYNDGVRVGQKIKKTVTFQNPVQLNKQYSLLIHLGLTSVKFTATVSGWDQVGTIEDADLSESQQIHLPINVKTVTP